MTRRTARITASIAFTAALAMLLLPGAVASEKGGTLAVVSYHVVGNQVLVKVSNPGTADASGFVVVDAVTGPLPVRSGAAVTVRPGSTAFVPVSFGLPVTGVEGVWIVDGADPVN